MASVDGADRNGRLALAWERSQDQDVVAPLPAAGFARRRLIIYS